MSLFSSGRIEITPAAEAALARVHAEIEIFPARHESGDWGEVEEKRWQYNNLAVRQNQVLLSTYKLGDDAELMVTTAADRSLTLVLLSSEYSRREVSIAEGYALWSETYDNEKNSLIVVEEAYVDAILATLPVTAALDVGCGTGRHALKLARRGIAVTAIDASLEMLAIAQEKAGSEGLGIDFQLASISDDLRIAPEQFDLLICALMLDHVPDLAHAISECYRVLQPGGFLLITDFHPDAIARGWQTMFTRPGGVYLLPNMAHTRANYLEDLGASGFTVLKVIDALVREIPDDNPSKAILRDRLDETFCLIMLAQK